MGASELYEAGMALPPSVRKDVAMRLLDSVEDASEDAVDETWNAEIRSRVDDIVSGNVETVPGEQVFAELAERRAERAAARNT